MQIKQNRISMNRFKLYGVVALLGISSLATKAVAQDSYMSMSLDECLTYAKDNSITLQKAKLEVESSKADKLSAKGAFMPSLAGSVGQSISSYPTNEDASLRAGKYSGSYGLDLSLSLYSGGKNRAQLKQSQLGIEIADLNLNEYENTIETSVTETFVAILYAIEQIKVCEKSLEFSQKTEARGEAFLEVGSINEVDFAQLQSSTASSEYDLVVAQSNLSNLYVVLKHLLEISQEMTLEVKEPDLSNESLLSYIPTVRDVYNSAVYIRPEIQSSKLGIESAKLGEKIAKSGYLPSLSLSAATGANHNNFDSGNQLGNNFSTSAGVTLSIPIFSNYKNKSSVAIAKNTTQIAALSLTELEKDLYQTIETLRTNAQNAQAKYAVSETMLEASRKSLELTSKQYELGMKNTIDLLTEQDNYNQDYQEYLINKYQLILNKALLNFYKTDIIKL